MKRIYSYGLLLLICATGWAQDGSQMLDGIGETALVARYIFDGNTRDWSRNNLHGNLHGEDARFIQDKEFGTVLSLYPQPSSFVSIPRQVLSKEESYTFSGWFYLLSDQQDRVLFDFRTGSGSQALITTSIDSSDFGCRAMILSNAGGAISIDKAPIEINRWVHVALVANGPSKLMQLYLNGQPSGEAPLTIDLSEVFNDASGEAQFHIGKSIHLEDTTNYMRLHDFRVYRIPLDRQQVSKIYKNALGLNDPIVNEVIDKQENQRSFSDSSPQLYNTFLMEVSDVEVVTVTGQLPRLPRYVSGKYAQGIPGPKVRVIWPAPTDNSQVLEPGKYIVTGKIPGTNFQPKATVYVRATGNQKTPEQKLIGFKLSQITLNTDTEGSQTKFIENRDKFLNVLSSTNPDDFLYMFRNAYSQKQPDGATPLAVWDSQETKLRGHATGHYLTAIAQAYASTAYDKVLQKRFEDKMDYMVDELYKLAKMSGMSVEGMPSVDDPTAIPPGPNRSDYDSDLSEENIRTDYWNWGRGFISAYPPDQFIMLERGATYGTQNTQIWAPYYTLHKILAGLMDIYEISGNKKALEITEGMGTWVHARLSQLPTETLISMWNRYIAGEYGGMNEAMARLYNLTGDAHYLETAQLFDNIRVFFGDEDHLHGLAKNVDLFRGLHANQHIPQIVGALETYQSSGLAAYYHIADNFWYKAVNDYTYSIGGVAGARNPANAECFTSQPATLYENGLSEHGQNETCATYNLLKLTQNLFMYDPRAELMDYYEKGLYNHILASVAENSPANTYHVPLRPGSVKSFGNPDMTGFTCCNGTALESNTKLQNAIYLKSADEKSLYINLFIPSTLEWSERNVQIRQETLFPMEDRTKIIIKGKGKFDLNIRVPFWATAGFFVAINGQDQKVSAVPGSYLQIKRKWKDGDIVELHTPFVFRLEPVMDQPNLASLFYGPVLLAAQESESRQDWRKVTLNAKNIGQSIQGDPTTLHFTIDGVLFKPFYDTYGNHSVYLDVTLE